MLKESIELISKQKEMYITQKENLNKMTRTIAVEEVKKKLDKEIELRNYILRVLRNQEKNH